MVLRNNSPTVCEIWVFITERFGLAMKIIFCTLLVVRADYLEEVLHESEKDGGKDGKDDWENGITFTAHPSRKLTNLQIIEILSLTITLKFKNSIYESVF